MKYVQVNCQMQHPLDLSMSPNQQAVDITNSKRNKKDYVK